jgi:nucleoside-diphosphate-sugar epimerase
MDESMVSEKQILLSSEALLDLDLDFICLQLADEFAEMSGKKLLITGGAGFLGYYFTMSVLHWNKRDGINAPIAVTIVDNFKRGIPGWLEAVKSNANICLRDEDISKPLASNFVAADYIIHAAGIASPKFYRRYPLETIDANINGLRHLLEHCRSRANSLNPVQGFLFMSSSEIYGDPTPENIPTPEDFRGFVSCTGPRACYDESKRFGETLCVIYSQQFDLPVKMARPFNNYGPGLKITDGRVLSDFMQNIFRNEDIVLLSDGSPTRTFCYAADAICGYYKTLLRGRPGEPYNIGAEAPEVSMRDLAEKVVALGRRCLNYKGTVRLGVANEKDYLTDNPNRRCPVIQKARNELGYNPGVPLDDGLYRLLSWYSHNLTSEEA